MAVQTHTREIEQMVEGINDAWISKRFDDLDQYFHSQIVLVQPGTTDRISGRNDVINTYEEFMESAQVSNFKIMDMIINVFESTAIAQYIYRIKYQVETTKYDEDGTETMVFHHHNHRWLLVWRTQQPGP